MKRIVLLTLFVAFVASAGNSQLVTKHCLRPATVQDYKDWMDGYVRRGGGVTNFIKFPLEGSDEYSRMYVANKDFHLTPLYDGDSVTIIIPRGIKVTGSELGHNTLLFMEEGYKIVPSHRPVSVYADTRYE